tara:strand:+ start:2751 stop:2984 length:234 start_codon:yes stop_codon:yes gene_type:complete
VDFTSTQPTEIIMTKTKPEPKTTNVTVACDHDMVAEIDKAIGNLNSHLPKMAQINRARFVRACVSHMLENPEMLLKQ